MHRLLKVPIALLFDSGRRTDNVELWKDIMMKALQLGHSNNQIAMTCIIMLEQWFSELPPQITAKLYAPSGCMVTVLLLDVHLLP